VSEEEKDELINVIAKLQKENKELKGKIYCLKRKIKTWKEKATALNECEEWFGS